MSRSVRSSSGYHTEDDRAPTRSALRLPFLLTLFLILLSFDADVYANIRLRWSFWGVALALLAWQLILWYRAAAAGRSMEIQLRITRAHWVQAIVQLCIYLYWGWHWRNTYDQATLILAQLVFAYVFDILLVWSKRNHYFLGFGQFPIVLSTNLFLWFKDDWFVWQFAMIAVGQMGKELISWNKEGRRTHIFNPSGFSLTVFSIALLATGNTGLTWGEEIARTLVRPEFIYVEIFLLGLVVQYFFSVTLVTLSAVAALYVLNSIYSGVTGGYWFIGTNVPVAIFLGLHLLVTDPSTSPRSGWGRVMFGALYGAAVLALYGLLESLQMPSHYDKLLCVPFLNLSIQLLDRWGGSFERGFRRFTRLDGFRSILRTNIAHMSIWVAFFAFVHLTGFIGKQHEGKSTSFWRQACKDGTRNGCRNLMTTLAGWCHQGKGGACNEVAVKFDEGKIIARSPSGAVRYFQKACELGLHVGCTNAVIAYLFRPEDQLQKRDVADAYKKIEELCDGEEDGLSCLLIGYSHASGRGARQDVTRAVEYYERACHLGTTAGCKELAKILNR